MLWLQFVLLSWTLNGRKTWVVSGEGVRGVTSTKACKHGHFNFLLLLSSFSFCHHRLKLDLLGEDRFSGNKSHLIRPKLATTIQALCAPTGINQAPKHLPPRADVRELSFPCYPQIPQQPGGWHHPLPWPDPGRSSFFPLGGIVSSSWMDWPLIHLSMCKSEEKGPRNRTKNNRGRVVKVTHVKPKRDQPVMVSTTTTTSLLRSSSSKCPSNRKKTEYGKCLVTVLVMIPEGITFWWT